MAGVADPKGPHDRGPTAAAATALREGALVILPTETVYGVFGGARHPGVIGTLRAARERVGSAPAAPLTWHAPDAAPALEALGVGGPIAKHVTEKLAPGPVRFLVELEPAAMTRALAALGVPAGVIDDGDAVHVRVPDADTTREVLRRADAGPIVGERVGLLGLGDGRELPADARNIAEGAGVRAVINEGPTRLGRPSTTIRLTREGWYRVESVGALSEEDVRRRVEKMVLFVCTGNTCRSPMATAIARHYFSRHGAALVPTRVESAGVSAYDGDAMTPDAAEALRALRVDPGRHRSRPLTRAMIDEADHIFVMTKAHAKRITDVAPEAAGKVEVLDPSGRDVADPMGGSANDYHAAAEQIAEHVKRRLTDLGLLRLPARKGVMEAG
ncbi:MAG TPA: Sua5/YciO/YrdC/YwlC family protein [Phycisphaerales bacterium]|nr:Sua5/YciO/YrdC/YwlC family protein [Phycisphaerales bacterium]